MFSLFELGQNKSIPTLLGVLHPAHVVGAKTNATTLP